MVAWWLIVVAALVGMIAGAVWYAVYALRRFDKMRADFEARAKSLISQMADAVRAERDKIDLIKKSIKDGALAGSPEKGRHQLAVLNQILKEAEDDHK